MDVEAGGNDRIFWARKAEFPAWQEQTDRMSTTDANSKSALGFLTVIEHPEHGLFGGYLLLNLAGRPLEFHCTTPVKPNRAQRILYGFTLEPYLCGEQIGQALLRKAEIAPLAICTDREAAMAVRQYVDAPVALVLRSEEELQIAPAGGDAASPAAKTWRLDGAHASRPPYTVFRLGRNRLAVPVAATGDREQIASRLEGLADWFDLAEPFARIREAIEEARRV
jgi:hypothetical protein